jgi:hypothetical protein
MKLSSNGYKKYIHYLLIFVVIVVIIVFGIIAYYLLSLKEGFKQVYNPNDLLEYNPDSPLTVQNVDVVNNFYSCKNFCGPKAQCAITREQCIADIDCKGCVPPNIHINKNKNTLIVENFESLLSNKDKNNENDNGKNKDNCEIQNDVAAGKLTFSQTPQYSTLTTDIGAFARIINPEATVPRMYEGIDTWTRAFNYGLKLAYNKLPKLTPFEKKIEPEYPVTVTMTGAFYDVGPTPSNATI